MKIKLFYLKHCPYCKSAFKALDELQRRKPFYKKLKSKPLKKATSPMKPKRGDYIVPTYFVMNKRIRSKLRRIIQRDQRENQESIR